MSMGLVDQSEAMLSELEKKCGEIKRARAFGREVTTEILQKQCTCKSHNLICVRINLRQPTRGVYYTYIHLCSNPECHETRQTPREEHAGYRCTLCTKKSSV